MRRSAVPSVIHSKESSNVGLNLTKTFKNEINEQTIKIKNTIQCLYASFVS